MRSTNEVYGSLAYDGAQLLRVPLCVSWAFIVSVGVYCSACLPTPTSVLLSLLTN